MANVFHAGDGNLHPLILFDGREPGAVERAEALAGEILDLCVRLGGSITGEHGIGVEKRDFLPRMFDSATLAAMRRVARSVDPLELANRGKMFPTRDGHAAPRRRDLGCRAGASGRRPGAPAGAPARRRLEARAVDAAGGRRRRSWSLACAGSSSTTRRS